MAPRSSAGNRSTPASGPNCPPVQILGPVKFTLTNAYGFKPLTGNPKTTPSKKFQPMCNPMGSQSWPVKIYPNERKSPAKNIPNVEIQFAPGLSKCDSAKAVDEIKTPQVKFIPSEMFCNWYPLDNNSSCQPTRMNIRSQSMVCPIDLDEPSVVQENPPTSTQLLLRAMINIKPIISIEIPMPVKISFSQTPFKDNPRLTNDRLSKKRRA